MFILSWKDSVKKGNYSLGKKPESILWNLCHRNFFIFSWSQLKYSIKSSVVLLVYVFPTYMFSFSSPLFFRLSHITTLLTHHHYCWTPRLLSLNLQFLKDTTPSARYHYSFSSVQLIHLHLTVYAQKCYFLKQHCLAQVPLPSIFSATLLLALDFCQWFPANSAVLRLCCAL